MADTKIGMKIEEEIKPLKELCEKLVKMASAEIDKGAENIETHELYEVADIIKDFTEAKKNTVESCYKIYIAEAMEQNSDSYGEEWDEDGLIDQRKNYSGQMRDSKGRYMSRRGRGGRGYVEPIQYQMDMDLYRMNPEDLRRRGMTTGVHYYTEDGTDRMNSSNTQTANDNMRKGYDNGWNDGYSEGMKKGGNSNSRMERARRNYEEKHDMASLEELMNAMKEEIEKEKPNMDVNQKNMAKSKLTNIVNMI